MTAIAESFEVSSLIGDAVKRHQINVPLFNKAFKIHQ